MLPAEEEVCLIQVRYIRRHSALQLVDLFELTKLDFKFTLASCAFHSFFLRLVDLADPPFSRCLDTSFTLSSLQTLFRSLDRILSANFIYARLSRTSRCTATPWRCSSHRAPWEVCCTGRM